MKLSEGRTALTPILIGAEEIANGDSILWYAAKELRFYFGRMTGAVFAVGADTPEVRGVRVRMTDAYGEEGYHLRITRETALIEGGPRGVLYGCYELLERLGCRFFTDDCEKIPATDMLILPETDETGAPAFEYREHNYISARRSARFAVRMRLNGAMHPIPACMGGNKPYAWYVHSFESMIPPEEYADTHPEYFAMRDGKRVTTGNGRSQLCLTNPEVLHICKQKVRERLLSRPDARIISVSQNDWNGGCECEACRRIDEEEGSPSGALLRFVNEIARELEPEFPDIVFDTLAYQYTRKAPRITRPRANVCVRLCSIECCFAHPFAGCESEASRAFCTDLRQWGAICDRLYVWDYLTCFSNYPSPQPNWRTLQPNLRLMRDNHVRGVFEQANGASRGGTDFNELRAYLVSRLLWDPDCDIETHMLEFMEYYYGAAAPALKGYLDLLCDTVERERIHVGYNDYPTGEYLREELLERYNAFFDEAAAAVAGDALRLYRVEKARLSLRWVALKRKTMLRGEYDREEIERFTADWRAYGLSRVEEWANFENSHRALLDGKWLGRWYFEHWNMEEEERL